MHKGPATAAEPREQEDELLPLAKLPNLLEDQVVTHCGSDPTSLPLTAVAQTKGRMICHL